MNSQPLLVHKPPRWSHWGLSPSTSQQDTENLLCIYSLFWWEGSEPLQEVWVQRHRHRRRGLDQAQQLCYGQAGCVPGVPPHPPWPRPALGRRDPTRCSDSNLWPDKNCPQSRIGCADTRGEAFALDPHRVPRGEDEGPLLGSSPPLEGSDGWVQVGAINSILLWVLQ